MTSTKHCVVVITCDSGTDVLAKAMRELNPGGVPFIRPITRRHEAVKETPLSVAILTREAVDYFESDDGYKNLCEEMKAEVSIKPYTANNFPKRGYTYNIFVYPPREWSQAGAATTFTDGEVTSQITKKMELFVTLGIIPSECYRVRYHSERKECYISFDTRLIRASAIMACLTLLNGDKWHGVGRFADATADFNCKWARGENREFAGPTRRPTKVLQKPNRVNMSATIGAAIAAMPTPPSIPPSPMAKGATAPESTAPPSLAAVWRRRLAKTVAISESVPQAKNTAGSAIESAASAATESKSAPLAVSESVPSATTESKSAPLAVSESVPSATTESKSTSSTKSMAGGILVPPAKLPAVQAWADMVDEPLCCPHCGARNGGRAASS